LQLEDLADARVNATARRFTRFSPNLVDITALKYWRVRRTLGAGRALGGAGSGVYVQDFGPAFLPNICLACSSASIAWIRPAPASRVAQD